MKPIKKSSSKQKCSFDYDGCLEIDVVGDYAKELHKRGVDVYVTTSRMDNTEGNPNWNDDLFHRVSQLGLDITKVRFMNMVEKWRRFHYDNDFAGHLDDDWQAVKEINDNTTVTAITNFGNENWKEECEALLNNAQEDFHQ